MKFIDEALFLAEGGRGGDGCRSFRREKFVPKGGPDGGDGGRGGDVVVRAVSDKSTLFDIRHSKHYKAEKGAHGRGKNQHGRKGKNMEIRVPRGTVVYDDRSGTQLADLTEAEEEYVIAEGASREKQGKPER